MSPKPNDFGEGGQGQNLPFENCGPRPLTSGLLEGPLDHSKFSHCAQAPNSSSRIPLSELCSFTYLLSRKSLMCFSNQCKTIGPGRDAVACFIPAFTAVASWTSPREKSAVPATRQSLLPLQWLSTGTSSKRRGPWGCPSWTILLHHQLPSSSRKPPPPQPLTKGGKATHITSKMASGFPSRGMGLCAMGWRGGGGWGGVLK